MLTNVTTITIRIVLTFAATTAITIRKAKLAVINARRSSKYKKKYMIFFCQLLNSKAATNLSEKKTPIANSTKIHPVGTEILHPEGGEETIRCNEVSSRY